MAKFSKARRVLQSELEPLQRSLLAIREDRRLLARLHNKLKRDEARHLQTAHQIEQALAALQEPAEAKRVEVPEQREGWSALANEGRHDGDDKTMTAAKRLVKRISRRHEPQERSALLRMAGLLRGGLARLRLGRDRQPVGKVTVSFDPNSRRDLLRVLEMAGVYMGKTRARGKSIAATPPGSIDLAKKTQNNRGM